MPFCFSGRQDWPWSSPPSLNTGDYTKDVPFGGLWIADLLFPELLRWCTTGHQSDGFHMTQILWCLSSNHLLGKTNGSLLWNGTRAIKSNSSSFLIIWQQAEAQLNTTTIADFLAPDSTAFAAESNPPYKKSQRIFMWLNGTRLLVTSHNWQMVRYHIHRCHSCQFMQSKCRWTNKVWDSINLALFGKCFGSLDPKNQIFQMKFSHDQLSLSAPKLKWANVQASQITTCPCCKQQSEDMSHFFIRKSNKAIHHRKGDLPKDRISSDPQPLWRIVNKGISTWTFQLRSSSQQIFPPTQKRFWSLIQRQISWDNAIRGYTQPVCSG